MAYTETAYTEKILEIKDLSISFQTSAGTVNAIRGVNLDLHRGETLAIVGESGSGKSVTVKSIMGITSKNEHVNHGEILYTYEENGEKVTRNLLSLPRKQIIRHYCGQRIAMVFQDPMTSLNPTMSIGKQVMEGIRKHRKMNRKDAWNEAVNLLTQVGIVNPEHVMKSYAHQLSGGMRQRVVIAIAIGCNPDILICDEPTTALDVTIQARILELIQKLQKQRNLSIIYITHDLGVVAKVANTVAIMYAGKIVEKGTSYEVFYDPKHPYTWGLLSAIPSLDSDGERLYTIPGSPANLLHEVKGDAFAPRNRYALNIDFEEEPPVFKISDTHEASTWLLHPDAPEVHPPIGLQKRIQQTLQEGLFI
ncbi:MAG: ABC transporter ATP-binding protein [Lachnospiraceae bacterium]|nr:ABC transporter ATP-binding protein [Lachnospiraceae bacterium]